MVSNGIFTYWPRYSLSWRRLGNGKTNLSIMLPTGKEKCSSSASPASLMRRDRLRNALQSRWLMCIATRRYEHAQWSLIQEQGQTRQLATQLTRCVGSGSPSRRPRCCVRIRAQTTLPRREIGSWTAIDRIQTESDDEVVCVNRVVDGQGCSLFGAPVFPLFALTN
ncbi:hypothetical protein BGZ61DRAFT_29724 [Ilyonectria robusta]|uniref:uncharacterized protein n=1 Tax=Ilyonectria robusta TaxID=1079257 RepID=UPI001E8DA4C1|nr:uncharacterized protein BGZ61DRAFT_29724 [Ilyonectria robusta]KAH8738243.1 hypothetical protein BGZ61DRAFT_29724 [Ilyonectria robusta]